MPTPSGPGWPPSSAAVPPALGAEAQAGLKVAVQAAPAAVGLALANWNWKAVRQFVEARCGVRLCRSACTRYLHRLGFVYKRPKKRLLKADEAKRAAFGAKYAALLVEARASGAKIFFADDAHFRADADLHGKWVLKGQPALVESRCPRWGEKASDYSAVCLETGEVGAHGTDGDQLVRDERGLANTCLGTKAAVQEKTQQLLAGLTTRAGEVQSRCRRKLQAPAEAVVAPSPDSHPEALHEDLIGASV